MSLSSKELNYLIWRYLQEAGYELAAFALEKYAECLTYEHDKNLSIISRIEPGCLVDLVQKGILFTMARDEVEEDEEETGYKRTLLGSVLEQENSRFGRQGDSGSNNNNINNNSDGVGSLNHRFRLKSEVGNGKELGDTFMEGVESSGAGLGHGSEFITKRIAAGITYPQSLTSDWHRSLEVFAYGRGDSTAVISALKEGVIAESVTLHHPNVLNISNESNANEITAVSWAPRGNIIVTGGIDGQLRAWSPDGKLKNVSNISGSVSTDFDTGGGAGSSPPVFVSNLIWSDNGQYLLTIDTNNQVNLWEGNNLSLLQVITNPSVHTNSQLIIDACWIDDFRFAISTQKKRIKIFLITPAKGNFDYFNPAEASSSETSLVKCIGELPGHENEISILKFNPAAKLLASCSDYDYVIRVWRRSSKLDYVELSASSDIKSVKFHRSPIICLSWVSSSNLAEFLLSISMEGNTNIWNTQTGEAELSTNLFVCDENFKFDGKDPVSSFSNNKEALVLNAAVSPDQKWLAVGDNLGRVSLWDITLSHYSKGIRRHLKCVGAYEPTIDSELQDEKGKPSLCDFAWNEASLKIAVSYQGAESVIIEWLKYF